MVFGHLQSDCSPQEQKVILLSQDTTSVSFPEARATLELLPLNMAIMMLSESLHNY